MADIAMCGNENCPLKMKCYRFTAIPTPNWQSYIEAAPGANGKCRDFWDNAGRWSRFDAPVNTKG